MMDYDKKQPLIFLHIPKMGGTSIRAQYRDVFKENLFLHYNEQIISSGLLIPKMPGRLQWKGIEKLSLCKPVCIYGHFRRTESTDVNTYYPKASQFATVFRDPLETVISSYFYTRRMNREGVPIPIPHTSLNDWLEHVSSEIFNHLPLEAENDMENFLKTKLVTVSTLNKLSGHRAFLREYFSYVSTLPRINTSERSEKADPEVIKRWKSKNDKEISLYSMVLELETKFNGE